MLTNWPVVPSVKCWASAGMDVCPFSMMCKTFQFGSNLSMLGTALGKPVLGVCSQLCPDLKTPSRD